MTISGSHGVLFAEKQMSPDTSFSRDGPPTPSSTSSTRESTGGRSVNRRDGKGETPLHAACKKGDCAAVKKLLDDGADVNAACNAGILYFHCGWYAVWSNIV